MLLGLVAHPLMAAQWPAEGKSQSTDAGLPETRQGPLEQHSGSKDEVPHNHQSTVYIRIHYAKVKR